MIEFGDTVEIAAPPARVFDFVSDLENLPKFQSDVVRSTVLDPGPVHVGTRFEEVVKVGPRHVTARCVVTEYEPGEHFMAFRAESRVADYEGRFLVEPAGDGARASISGTVRLKGVWRLLEPLMRADIRKGLEQELGAIRRHTEESGRS